MHVWSKFFLLTIGFAVLQSAFAQERNLSFELAGSGGFASINFERTFKQYNDFNLAYRVGFTATPIDKNNGTALVFPVMLHGIYGANKHKLDVGLGQGLTLTTKGSYFALTTAAVGWRIEPEDKRWFYRLSYTPLISYWVDFQWQHWGGFTVGYKLKSKE